MSAALTARPQPGPATTITRLPSLTREESLEYWGLNPSHHWPELDAATSLAEYGWEGDGWIVTNPSEGGQWPLGMTAHRRVTQAEEHVDYAHLLPRIEGLLGFTVEQVRAAFANGRPTQERLELRGRIDARLLEIENAGGNLLELARVLGLSITRDTAGVSNCRAVTRALARAREAATCAR